MNTAKSVNGVTIRLPDERWVHITEEHAEMAGYLCDVLETVQEPLAVFEGNEANYSPPARLKPENTSSLFIEKQARKTVLSLRHF